eukprot:TRINITY_DN5202_c0_g1_i7.p1 TRINITY_DN5202_c0_g1~~TRINITY_DN5202_c0_g1_i7.p1  ORF type:complete len:451 (-),score=87.42 TRINITY_DN5202_c0_g1_i7:555-1907(-)
MFQNAFQSGAFLDVFDSKVTKEKEKLYTNLVRLVNPNGIKNEFDKSLKTFVYELEGSSCKLQLPKDDKQELGLVQPYIVLQIYIAPGQQFGFELVVTDTTKSKRRMMFTSALKSVELNYFHCKIPISTVKRGIWLNLSIDLVSFMSLFKGQTFRSLDTIVINGPCKVRRLFTMRAPLVETLSEDGTEQQSNLLNTAFVPKTMALATGISNVNQVLNLDVVMRYIEMEKGALNPMGLQAVGRATTSNGASREGVTTKSSISSNQEEQKIGSPTPSQTEIPNKRILTKPETPNNHAQRRIASAVASNRPFKQRNSADAEESKEEQKVAQPKFRLQMRQNTASGTKLHVPPTKPIERIKKAMIPEEKEESSPLQVTSQQNSASKASNQQTQAKAKEIEAQGQHSPKPKSQGIRLSGLKAMPPARSNPMRISSRLGKKNLLASDEKNCRWRTSA